MQEIDVSFDEKDLGISKFSRFVQEAANKGLLTVSKLENGQLEIGASEAAPAAESRNAHPETTSAAAEAPTEDGRPRRTRRGRGGRGRDREDRGARAETSAGSANGSNEASEAGATDDDHRTPPRASREVPATAATSTGETGRSGERLTRQEAFDLVRRSVDALTTGESPVRASEVRAKARDILGRDSESLDERMFIRILKDAHDNGVIDLRRRGDDFEVAPAAEAESVADQLAKAAAAASPAPVATTPGPRVGMGHRGAGRGRGRLGAPPADLLSIGVVNEPAVASPEAAVEETAAPAASSAKPARAPRKAAAKKPAKAKTTRSRTPAAKTRAKKAPSRSAT
jgi:hypothetical protein